MALQINKLEFPSSKNALCKSVVEIGPVFLEKKNKNVKRLQTDGRTDARTDGNTTGDQKSSIELSAQMS